MLEVHDIVSGYGELEILHGASMSAGESAIVALLGPNGSGKSTLLKTIFGFLKPKRGQILFNEEDITGSSPETMLSRGIAYVPQQRTVFKYLTVLDNLRLGGYLLSKDEFERSLERIYAIFSFLKERSKQIASSLSGGEQRMLEIARALMMHPQLILLDEPSANLAPIMVDAVFKEIKKLASNEKISFVVVEQNIAKAVDIAEYVYVLDMGRVALEGTHDAILDVPKMRALYLGS